eukprot:353827-Chlamydomonas_euryale.AAC.2
MELIRQHSRENARHHQEVYNRTKIDSMLAQVRLPTLAPAEKSPHFRQQCEAVMRALCAVLVLHSTVAQIEPQLDEAQNGVPKGRGATHAVFALGL